MSSGTFCDNEETNQADMNPEPPAFISKRDTAMTASQGQR